MDEWLYLSIGWEQFKGLHLYINGQRKVAAVVPFLLPTQDDDPTVPEKSISIGCFKNQSNFLPVYIMMVDVAVGLPDMQALIVFAPPIFRSEYLITAASVFDASLTQRHLKATADVKESRGTIIFDGIHALLHDLGAFAGTRQLRLYFLLIQLKFLNT